MHSKQKSALIIWYIKCLFFVWQSDLTEWWYIKCLFFVWQSDLTKWWYIKCLFFVWQSDSTRPSDGILNVCFLSDSLTKCLTVWAKVTWYIWSAYCLTESNQVMVYDCFPWGMGITKVSDSERSEWWHKPLLDSLKFFPVFSDNVWTFLWWFFRLTKVSVIMSEHFSDDFSHWSMCFFFFFDQNIGL